MKWDFRHHLLLQIEMLRGDISYQELSERLGDITERCLARYIAGKSHLTEGEFRDVAKALRMDAHALASAWASSLGLRISGKDVVSRMVERAYSRWRQHSRVAGRGVPSNPSALAVIRARYAARLPRKTPPLWFGAHYHHRERKGSPESRARFARAYEMLVDSVHGGMSAPDIGALRGISGSRARHLMICAAYTWAKSERLDLSGKSVPFKNEARFVKNLYAGLRFFGQEKFNESADRATAKELVSDGDETS
jgi:hypothetical protein